MYDSLIRGVLISLFALLASAVGAAGIPDIPSTASDPPILSVDAKLPVDGPVHLLLGSKYPIEINVSHPAALLHWVDSLAGFNGDGATAGKTITIHQREFVRRLGQPTDEELKRLLDYVNLRRSEVQSNPDNPNELNLCFFESRSFHDARTRCLERFPPKDRVRLRQTLLHFEKRFEPIWNQGETPRKFLARAAREPRRVDVENFLVDLSRFFGVPPRTDLPPRIILAAVENGGGTHAQAIGRFLLIEVRPSEGLIDEISPIVHENVHFLFNRIDTQRLDRLHAAALSSGEAGPVAWNLLREALPTALAQGLGGEMFLNDRWSLQKPWYHRSEIDSYAKRIFPIVKRAFLDGRRLDAKLIRRLVEAH